MQIRWAQVRRRRLARHWLVKRGDPSDLPAIASAVCGIHAQIMPAAELSFGARADVTRSQIRDALWRDRSLIRTYGVRGTVHIFAASEGRLWMAARRARSALDEAWEARRLNYLGLTASQVDELVAATDVALKGRTLTMKELGQEVVRLTGAWAGKGQNEAWLAGWPNWRTALPTAAQREVLCFGPPRGQEVTFVRLDDWIGPGQRWDEGDALRTVFRRFLHTYGPASAASFNQWFLLPVAVARQLAADMPKQIVEVAVDGSRSPLLATDNDFEEADAAKGSVRLLPHFDCYLRGFFPRQELGAQHAKRAAGGTGQFPVLLVDGQVAGVWERRAQGRRIAIRVDSFVPLNKRQLRELQGEARRIGHVLQCQPELELGPVKVRPHL